MAKKVVKRRKHIVKRSPTQRRKRPSYTKTKKYIFSFLLAICLGFLAFFLTKDYRIEAESFESEKYYVKGIDLSHHNPIINWDALLDQNIYFAYIKATEGSTHLDRNYPYNYDLARKANIKVGAYHFYTFSLSGKEQARHFINTAKFNTGDLLPAIDVEHSPTNLYNKDKESIALVVKELKALENELFDHFGIHPVIYTNKDCYKLYIKDNFLNNPIWMCDLHNEPSKDVRNWKIWQFSHKGELPGVNEHVDLNYYRYSFDDFKELLLP